MRMENSQKMRRQTAKNKGKKNLTVFISKHELVVLRSYPNTIKTAYNNNLDPTGSENTNLTRD